MIPVLCGRGEFNFEDCRQSYFQPAGHPGRKEGRTITVCLPHGTPLSRFSVGGWAYSGVLPTGPVQGSDSPSLRTRNDTVSQKCVPVSVRSQRECRCFYPEGPRVTDRVNMGQLGRPKRGSDGVEHVPGPGKGTSGSPLRQESGVYLLHRGDTGLPPLLRHQSPEGDGAH